MCTIESIGKLCKSTLEASLVVMVPLEMSCGRGAWVSTMLGAHREKKRACGTDRQFKRLLAPPPQQPPPVSTPRRWLFPCAAAVPLERPSAMRSAAPRSLDRRIDTITGRLALGLDPVG